MLELWLFDAFQLGYDPCRQDLAEFDAPLIEGINTPDCALDKHAVFIKRNQLAKGLRIKLFCKNGIRRSVAGKDAMRHQPLRRAFFSNLVLSFAEGQAPPLEQTYSP